MTDYTALPPNLPRPTDDGAAEHLPGLSLPDVDLPVAGGGGQNLGELGADLGVLFVYPRTGGPGIELPTDWDLIPGARGCTPQSCAFRDRHAELSALGARVAGLSAQPIEEQAEFAERMHLPFPLLNDRDHALGGPPLMLPTFDGGDLKLYKRLTLVVRAGIIEKAFYPVFPPDRNAADVLDHLVATR